MAGGRSIRVLGRIAVGGMVAVGIAVVLLMVAPLVWRWRVGSTATYQGVLDLMRLSNAVGDGLALLALVGLVTMVAGLAIALYRARRLTAGVHAEPEPARENGRRTGWRPVWTMAGGLGAVLVASVVVLAVEVGASRRDLALMVGGDTLDRVARAELERLYPLPSPLGVVLGLGFLIALAVLVVALVRRLGRMVC